MSAFMGSKPRVLHCHSTFSAGGKELRSVQLMNAFGQRLSHAIVSGEPDQLGATAAIADGVNVRVLSDFPSLKGFPGPTRLLAIAKAMSDYDLVLTYNWGAMDAAMAHTVFGRSLDLPPLVHHEDGFNEDEGDGLKARRNWYRRVALGKSSALVVPSKGLEKTAVGAWFQPASRVVRIPNGIDTLAFSKAPKPNSLRVVKHAGERWVGTLAGLRPVKQLPILVEAIAELPENWHLVILGEGPERDAIRAAADRLELSHRVHLPGAVSDPAKAVALFDIFALSSKSEQFPISVLEAMAAGLPIAAPDVGDIRDMVSEPNKPFIATAGQTGALASMVEELASSESVRQEVGEANRRKAVAQFDQQRMIQRYQDLYQSVLGREF